MASADDVKEMIRKRLEERKGAPKPSKELKLPGEPYEHREIEETMPVPAEELEVVASEPEPEEEDLSLFDEDEALPGFEEEADWDDFDPDLMNAFFEEGRQAYYNGLDQDQMPYVAEDFEDSEHAAVVVEAWNEGWYAAHGETWTALALLAARDLIAATDEDEMVRAMTGMQEAIKVLEDGVVNFDDLAEEFRSE